MNYTHPELLRQLSAEYALGTLRGRARRRFERLLRTSPDARAEVGFWEFRLSEFGQDLPPVAPPARTRAALLQRAAPSGDADLQSAPPATAKHTRFRRSMRRRRALRRWLSAAAASIALLAAFLTGQRYSVAPELPDEPVAVRHATVLPPNATEESFDPPGLYLAQLRLPASSMGWLLSLSPDHRQLTVVAADDYYTQGRQRFQLWWISPTQGPLPLVALPAQRFASTAVEIPREVLGESQVVFAISLEPQSGPRGKEPSGPVLSTSPRIDHI